MLGHLQHKSGRPVFYFQRIQNGRQSLVELNVYNSTNHGHDLALGARLGSSRLSIPPPVKPWKNSHLTKPL